MDIKNKKILVVTTTDNMIWQFLVPHIQMFEKMGAKVDCVCAKTGFFYYELKERYKLNVYNINFTRFPFTIKNLKGRQELKKLCKENKYDLIYCHQPVGGVMGRMMGKIFNIPVVYMAHGFHFYKGCPIKNTLLYKTIENHYSKYTSALITMNEEDFEASKQMKAKKNYKINGVGIDFDKYKIDKDFDENTLRKEIGVSQDDFIVLSIAEFIKRKNIITVLKAMENITEKNIKLVLCGKGVLEKELKKYVLENNLENKVIFLGYRKDIPEIIQISQVIVMASYHEGLPKSFMEAMAYGKPIICSNIRGSRDLVGNNEGGILCNTTDVLDYAHAITKLYEDKDLYKKFSNRNLKEIKNYSLENVIKQLKAIIKDL